MEPSTRGRIPDLGIVNYNCCIRPYALYHGTISYSSETGHKGFMPGVEVKVIIIHLGGYSSAFYPHGRPPRNPANQVVEVKFRFSLTPLMYSRSLFHSLNPHLGCSLNGAIGAKGLHSFLRLNIIGTGTTVNKSENSWACKQSKSLQS